MGTPIGPTPSDAANRLADTIMGRMRKGLDAANVNIVPEFTGLAELIEIYLIAAREEAWPIPETSDGNGISWPGPTIAVTLLRAEADALWQELDSLIPQGEHQIDAPGYLGELPLQRFMYFLRTGVRTEFLNCPFGRRWEPMPASAVPRG